MTEKHHALPVPCKSCPYRKDVPSGVWHESEYKKLPNFDGDIATQFVNGGTGLFLCHQQNNALCSGWLGCHGVDNLLALRLHGNHVEPEIFDYETDVPLFSSGAEAAAHGMRDIKEPREDAKKVINRLLKKRMRK
ncbi:hypothetical protein EVB29_072 [Rhizobium phage RHph_TM27A]|nr:hypothetical protein EVB29_072 [Rhizobium phage RHph_TM27A]QIG66992.1 hypothetical protein EVB30_072 [Rhizobium phage RHph_TM27B]